MWDDRDINNVTKDLRLLEKGRAFYAGGIGQVSVPAELRVGNRYVVPRLWVEKEHEFFQPTAEPEPFILCRADGRTRSTDPPGSVASFAEASTRWNLVASKWIAPRKRMLAVYEQNLRNDRTIPPVPTRFDLTMVQSCDFESLFLAGWVAGIDFGAAWMGRKVFLMRQARRRRQAS